MSNEERVNKPIVQVAGNIGQDPKMGETSNGTPVCSFSVAHCKKTGDPTLWVEVSVFGDPEAHAAFAAAHKGGFATAWGYHSTNEYNGKTYDKLNAKIVMFGGVYVPYYDDVPAQEPEKKPAAKPAQKPAAKQEPPPDFNDDEIPF